MEFPFAIWAIIPASEERRTDDIVLTRARTLSITTRVTYAAGATKPVQVNVYFSPDGSNWDTVPIDYYTVTLAAGQTVQESYLAAVPEHGWTKIGIQNQDSANAVTDVKVWYTIQSWKDKIEIARGAELKDITRV